MRKTLYSIVLSLLFLQANSGNWPGHAIVGNGKFCAVYSEDSRTTEDGNKGIRHFYFNDFTADYIQSAHFELFSKSMMVQAADVKPYMADFFTPAAGHYRGKTHVFTALLRAGNTGLIYRFEPEQKGLIPVFKIAFNNKLTGDDNRQLVELSAGENGDAYAQWSNEVRIRISSTVPYETIKTSDNSLELRFKTEGAFEVVLLPYLSGNNRQQAPGINTRLKPVRVNTAWMDAANKWKKWIEQGGLPYSSTSTEEQRNFHEFYSRNLYAAYSSTLGGQVPADVTGQFLTNGMPQLYPRDAMMTARNLMQCGYPEIAADIIRFWGRENIQHKTPGEFYARYDAYSRATDAGEGARYDEPEWDASGYFIILNKEYHDLTGKWLTAPEKLYQYADFISSAIDSTGLLYEGGIVEWTGYLPATNMICASALLTTIEIAEKEGRKDLAGKYRTAYKTIESSLPKLFDKDRKLYTARRYYGVKADDNFSIMDKKGELLYLWDVTSVFGILWGYPDHKMMQQTYRYVKENLNDNGGIRYFEATDKGWLEAYGRDLFYFATAAWAKYAIIQDDFIFAKKNLDWIIDQSNVYGLMPERVLSDYSGISEASPLTWGCSEFAAAAKLFGKKSRK